MKTSLKDISLICCQVFNKPIDKDFTIIFSICDLAFITYVILLFKLFVKIHFIELFEVFSKWSNFEKVVYL